MSLLRWTIFICIPSEISWEMGSPLLRRSFTRVERIAGFCSDRVEPGPRGEKGLLAGVGPVRCIGGQNWCLPNLVLARISSLNWWPESVARINGF